MTRPLEVYSTENGMFGDEVIVEGVTRDRIEYRKVRSWSYSWPTTSEKLFWDAPEKFARKYPHRRPDPVE